MRRTILAALAVLLALAGCGGHSKPYKTLPAPKLPPTLTAPSCGTGDNHSLGQCLPAPSKNSRLTLPRASGERRCVDLSNNDPIYGLGAWRAIRAAGFTCAWFKVNESTGFVDRTAAQMAHDAKQAGLNVGGYDFQHVCGPLAYQEADVFTSNLQADGLTGPGTLPGVGDVEFQSGSCDARAWELAWQQEAERTLHRQIMDYTGAWFWDPTFGCWWTGRQAWISGYVFGLGNVPRPCGHGHIDVWQNSDKGFNGVSSTDVSIWENGEAAYQALIGAPKRERCFGPRYSHSKACAVKRANVARWSRSVVATRRALNHSRCWRYHVHAQAPAPCRSLFVRGDWFHRAIRAAMR